MSTEFDFNSIFSQFDINEKFVDIHTEIQKIAGVATYSIGQDAERRIVICLEGKEKNRK